MQIVYALATNQRFVKVLQRIKNYIPKIKSESTNHENKIRKRKQAEDTASKQKDVK